MLACLLLCSVNLWLITILSSNIIIRFAHLSFILVERCSPFFPQLYNFESQPQVTCATFNSFKNEQKKYKSKWGDTIVLNRTSIIICNENERFIEVAHILFNLMCLLCLLHHCFSNPNDAAYKYLSLGKLLTEPYTMYLFNWEKKNLLNLCSFPEMCQ